MNNDVIATVNGKELTEADFSNYTKMLPPEQQQYLTNPEALAYFKEEFVTFSMFCELGAEEKLDETEEFKTMMENVKRQYLGQMAIRETLESATVTDEEIKEYYDNNQKDFQSQETVHAKHILMESEEEIKSLLGDITAGTVSFEDAAKEHSTCPSSAQGGDLGTFKRGDMVPEFDKAAFEADVNKVVGPVKTQFGYHLIKVEEKSEAGVTPFEQAKAAAKKAVLGNKQNQAYEDKIAELKAKYVK